MAERLTHYDEDGRVFSSRGWETTLSRLAAYEDTGLEPEEIKQMCALARLNSNVFDNDFGNHIAELIVAEQDGRLLVVPCKVGDTVCKHWKVGGKTEIGSALVTGFEIANDGINYCYRVKRFDRKETIKKFGKTVFLTRAEAEARLKELKNGTTKETI